MPEWLTKILGLNWKTTISGLTALGAIAAAIFTAWKARDFQAIVDNLPLFFTQLGVVIAALGLIKAKDQNVTGVGTTAKSVDDKGVETDRKGDVVGVQPPPPESNS